MKETEWDYETGISNQDQITCIDFYLHFTFAKERDLEISSTWRMIWFLLKSVKQSIDFHMTKIKSLYQCIQHEHIPTSIAKRTLI